MTRMTGPDSVVMCNLINIHIPLGRINTSGIEYDLEDRAGLRGYVRFNKYTYILHKCIHTYIHIEYLG